MTIAKGTEGKVGRLNLLWWTSINLAGYGVGIRASLWRRHLLEKG